jgi:hypothetical protein
MKINRDKFMDIMIEELEGVFPVSESDIDDEGKMQDLQNKYGDLYERVVELFDRFALLEEE